ILMTLNLVPLLKAKYPEHEIDYFCAPQYAREDGLGWIIKAAGCRGAFDMEPNYTPHDKYDKVFRLIGYPLHDGYPAVPMRKHLLEYFAEEMGLTLEGELPALSLPRPHRRVFVPDGPYISMQCNAGWSKYKTWDDDKWREVVRALPSGAVYEITEDAGLTLEESIAIFANATMHIGVDSFCNHLTNYLWDGKRVPGVILWGSTQCEAAGYPTNTNISKGLWCQPCFRESPHI